jgi:CRISPR/Cas system CSM-associated protein Csm2 small subunit
VKDAEDDNDALSYASQLKSRILDNAYNERKNLNTLALTQARERNKLNSVTALYDNTFGKVSGGGGSVFVDSAGFYS